MANIDTNILSKDATNITQLFSETDIIKTARSFNFIFDNFIDRIYLEINDTTDTPISASYLDLHLTLKEIILIFPS